MRNWINSTVRRFALWLLSWVDDCPNCEYPWRAHHCPHEAVMGDKVCSMCNQQLPIDSLKFHDGRFFCKACKAKQAKDLNFVG